MSESVKTAISITVFHLTVIRIISLIYIDQMQEVSDLSQTLRHHKTTCVTVF
jgi:hypothetical protein